MSNLATPPGSATLKIPLPAAATGGDECKVNVYQDLNEYIATKGTECLNESRRFPHGNLWKADERFMLQSDLDPQLLLKVPFTVNVKVYSIILAAPLDDASKLPTSLKIFVNKDSLGFDEVEDYFPTQEFELTPAEFDGRTELKLKFHKFQKVSSLHLFFDHEDDDDAEVSVLSSIHFRGKSTQTTDISAIKKVG